MSVLPHSRAGNSEQWRALNRVIQERWCGLLCCHADMQEGEDKKDPGAKGGRGYAGVEWGHPRALFPEKVGMPIFSRDHEACRSFVQWSVRRCCVDGNVDVCDQRSPLQRTGASSSGASCASFMGTFQMVWWRSTALLLLPWRFHVLKHWRCSASHGDEWKHAAIVMQDGRIQKPNNNSAAFWCVFL